MCGRISNRLSWFELHEVVGRLGAPLNLRPRYAAAPGQDMPRCAPRQPDAASPCRAGA